MMKAGWQWIFSLNLGSKQLNGTDDTKQDIHNPRINESAKSRPRGMYVVVLSCFHSILHLKT